MGAWGAGHAVERSCQTIPRATARLMAEAAAAPGSPRAPRRTVPWP